MDISRTPFSVLVVISLFFFINFHFVFALQTISPNELITDSDTVSSSNQSYKLGFFSPGNSTKRYLGVWYITSAGDSEIVWVANRNNSLNDSSGVLRINSDGNLVVLDGKENFVWTTNVAGIANSSGVKAELLDSGNLVLRVEPNANSLDNTSRTIWKSFDHPTNTLLKDMSIGVNTETGAERVLTSWTSDSDPSQGRFRLELEPNVPQLVIWNGSQRHWRSGPLDGRIFVGVEVMYSFYRNGFNFVREGGDQYVYFYYTDRPGFVGYVLNYTGQLRQMFFDEGENRWDEIWAAPQTECDLYGKCGSFGVCNRLSSPICSCLEGYNPISTEEWRKGNWSRGCIKRTPFQCERNNTNGEEGREDVFLKLEKMRIPEFAISVNVDDLEQCKQRCLMNCSCTAYSYRSMIGCMHWNGTLIDTGMFSTDGLDLYVRLAYSELDQKKNTKVIAAVAAVAVLGGLLIVGLCVYIFRKWRNKQQVRKRKMETIVIGNNIQVFPNREKLEEPELPIFTYEKLAVATDNFHWANKLGEGGFGSVYKGIFPTGEEIAVKRLSNSSIQGTEEFMNEVVVISKLQHRNLVRLLGCCIEREEKMLTYEYMPNKSLDAFLFDSTKKALIDWRTRFQIIEGIGRGILYLHRDSRLRVIHRDLKPSNILLDKDLNPKIADFGMARIFGGDELQANTRRVVGTYGYMSPEYVMKGLFSEKSDVYSYGVLLLEIVTGMKTISFNHHEESLSLPGYVWNLWNEDMTRAIIDPTVSEPSFEEVVRCIHVGLLCVQDLAKDRPTMSSIILMLTSEITVLPTPKRPTFMGLESTCTSDSSSRNIREVSRNNVSITYLEGR